MLKVGEDCTRMRSAFAAILMCLFAPALAGAEFWTKRKFPDWSTSDIQKILTDSPWARPVLIPAATLEAVSEEFRAACSRCEVKTGTPAVNTGSDTRLAEPLQVIVRWHSALPVKQALVKLRFGDEVSTAEEAAAYLAAQESAYVVGIWGLPAEALPSDNTGLKAGAFLKLKGRAPVQASDGQAAVEGDKARVLLYFPRTADNQITLADGQVEVNLKLGPLHIRRGFKLKDMVYEGRLEL